MENARAARLTRLFNDVVRGAVKIDTSKSALFLEAVRTRPNAVMALYQLLGIPTGKEAIRNSVCFNLTNEFLTNHTTPFLQYLQRDTALPQIDGGQLLQDVILCLVEIPIFWDRFKKEFMEKRLSTEPEESFAWLLSQLVAFPQALSAPYREDDDYPKIESRLLSSESLAIRTLGHGIKHTVESFKTSNSGAAMKSSGPTPGGRHDNDFADYKQISTVPTPDEVSCKEPPFLRTSDYLHDCPEDLRSSTHLDNQYRLMREDLLYELREDLQLSLGATAKKRKGRVTRIHGLRPLKTYCEETTAGPNGKTRRTRCALQLECSQDLPVFHNVKLNNREKHIRDDPRFLKHQSLACLLVDESKVIDFVTIIRDTTLLATHPKPIIVVQLEGHDTLKKTLPKIKSTSSITLVQIETPLFAYEFVLKALQQCKDLPLSDELLYAVKAGTSSSLPAAGHVSRLVEALRLNPSSNLQNLFQTQKPINLDGSQLNSLISALTQPVSLIQGPPGTGKSFVGSLIAKAVHDYAKKKILVVCYTNHALDDVLEGLLDIGIPESSMVRLGGKSTNRTEPLSIHNQKRRFDKGEYARIDGIRHILDQLDQDLEAGFGAYLTRRITLKDVMEYLEFDVPDYHSAFLNPKLDDGMQYVGANNKALEPAYLLLRWLKGQDAGVFKDHPRIKNAASVWGMKADARKTLYQEWQDRLESERVQALCDTIHAYNRHFADWEQAFAAKDVHVLKEKRIIGCTTSAAAKYGFSIQEASPGVVIVEEAGEILESHVLTALGPQVSQLVLIGDHKQLRPKVNNYALTVEKGEGYDLNVSLFERLIKAGYPHTTLGKQHRMRPEISDLIRKLTYPDLLDAPGTLNRPHIKGLQDDIIFINHAHPEGTLDQGFERRDSDSVSKVSKQNIFEAELVLNIVRYLGQQGYTTDNLVVLTPYLGQLRCLRDTLKRENDPILNDLDNYDLVRAGLMAPGIAKLTKKPIRIATIDNYQGEESDIVIVSLTRSNSNNDIGFMYAPERLNVLLSRARNGLIMVGNSSTFKGSKKGKDLWTKLFEMLNQGKHLYDGLPIVCSRHPNRKAILSKVEDFEDKCPDGGCTEPCDTTLSCGIHKCPSKCHNIVNHSKIECKEPIEERCDQGHTITRRCFTPAEPCKMCALEQKRAKQKAMAEAREKERREEAEQQHRKELAQIEADIEAERRKRQEVKAEEERAQIIRQKRADLAAARAQPFFKSTPQPLIQPNPTIIRQAPSPPPLSSALQAQAPTPTTSPPGGTQVQVAPGPVPAPSATAAAEFAKRPPSASVAEWERQKSMEGACNDSIDKLMNMVGLEAVKAQVLSIKAKIDTSARQGTDVGKERFNISFLGNPGTGKTTVARHYSSFLSSSGVIPGNEFVETSGSKLGYDGVRGAEDMLNKVKKAGGGTIFIDEAYQLTSSNNPGGGQVLDFLLTEMENNVGTLVFILAGYTKEMESFFEHNPGLPSRVPYTIKFEDYADAELMDMFEKLLLDTYKLRPMQVEDGYRGLYSRIAIRRLGRRRQAVGFGNARDLQVLLARIKERQATRLSKERREGKQPDDFVLTREDIIGPDPSVAIKESKAWAKLQGMIGLKSVKESVSNIVDSIRENYERELSEQRPLEFSLNRVFLGSPGTGKTTVASLYGQVLADLGLLSKGEIIVKNPSDFTGSVLGESEKNTKGILSNAVGKVLVIDEAYMLYGGGGDDAKTQNNQYKTSVIDTIVAEVQNVPGDDRCVLLLGYEKQMVEMFNNVNPGLARRFKVDEPFRFEDFNDSELLEIMEKKMKEQDLGATGPAKDVAIELLRRARNRPNFGNGGEVENLLSKAKERCLSRRKSIPVDERPKFVIFEPQDFDEDFDRGLKATENLAKLFEDIVGHEEIIQKLEGYQKVVQACRTMGRDFVGKVPTNFVFAGPPGTGKTTIARKMGKVYYDMGILSSTEVLECGYTDLVAAYHGQTALKTQSLLQKALGKVLFIDEAYRLGEPGYAKEAVDELVGLLTQETYKGKIIVILAGYDAEMQELMEMNTGLRSRFPEWVPFENLSPNACIDIIVKQLHKEGIVAVELLDEESTEYKALAKVIQKLTELPNWGNARDMMTLSTHVVNKALLSTDVEAALAVEGTDVVACAEKMLKEREPRERTGPKGPRQTSIPPGMALAPSAPSSPPSSSTAVGTSTASRAPTGPPSSGLTRGFAGRGRGRGQAHALRAPTPPASPPGTVAVSRDPGVSDKDWEELQAARRRVEELERRKKEEIAGLQRQQSAIAKDATAATKSLKKLEEMAARAPNEAAREEIEKQKKLAEDRERRLEEERQRIAGLVAKAQREEQERKRKEEMQVQRKLRSMGVCVAGYQWYEVAGGYRCGGGSHFVSRERLGL